MQNTDNRQQEEIFFTHLNEEELKDFIEKQCSPIKAIKNKKVHAYPINKEEAEKIAKNGFITFVYDKYGNPKEETINKNVVEGDFMINQNINGKNNSYIIPSEKFYNNYIQTETSGQSQPKSCEKIVYRIPEDTKISFKASWGSTLFLRGGGVIVIEDDGKGFYGINKEEFESTYSYLKKQKNKIK